MLKLTVDDKDKIRGPGAGQELPFRHQVHETPLGSGNVTIKLGK